jgi:hypothetical protein
MVKSPDGSSISSRGQPMERTVSDFLGSESSIVVLPGRAVWGSRLSHKEQVASSSPTSRSKEGELWMVYF